MEKIEPDKIRNMDYHPSQPEFVREALGEESFFQMIDGGLAQEVFKLDEVSDPKTGRILEQIITNKKTGEVVFFQSYKDIGEVKQPIHFRKDKKQPD